MLRKLHLFSFMPRCQRVQLEFDVTRSILVILIYISLTHSNYNFYSVMYFNSIYTFQIQRLKLFSFYPVVNVRDYAEI